MQKEKRQLQLLQLLLRHLRRTLRNPQITNLTFPASLTLLPTPPTSPEQSQ